MSYESDFQSSSTNREGFASSTTSYRSRSESLSFSSTRSSSFSFWSSRSCVCKNSLVGLHTLLLLCFARGAFSNFAGLDCLKPGPSVVFFLRIGIYDSLSFFFYYSWSFLHCFIQGSSKKSAYVLLSFATLNFCHSVLNSTSPSFFMILTSESMSTSRPINSDSNDYYFVLSHLMVCTSRSITP